MNVIGVGNWEFELHEDWELQEPRSGVPYLETPDGTKGCYIKGITFGQPQSSAEVEAQYLQEAHESSFLADPEAKWIAVERNGSPAGQDFLSTLDLYDQGSNYRVLSVVLAATGEALQVTLHDYCCQDYKASVRGFAPIASSLRRAQADA